MTALGIAGRILLQCANRIILGTDVSPAGTDDPSSDDAGVQSRSPTTAGLEASNVL